MSDAAASPRPFRWVLRHNPIAWYTHWLHTKWPAGEVESLPVVNPDGTTNVSGLYVVGDLSGVPLLKLSAKAGTEVIGKIADELGDDAGAGGGGGGGGGEEMLDVAIVGGGTAGFAAALEAEKHGLAYAVFEASEPFSTIVNFPKEKPIYKYPTDLELHGELQFHEKSDIKEGLLEDLREQTVGKGLPWVCGRVSHVERSGDALEVVLPEGVSKPEHAELNGQSWIIDGSGNAAGGGGEGEGGGERRIKAKRVVVAIGRTGNFRTLDVPGEEKDKVINRLHDPKDYADQKVLIVGGGDSAMEGAIALVEAGADVTLSYRRQEFNRPKPENRDRVRELAGVADGEGDGKGDADRKAPAAAPSDPRQSTATPSETDADTTGGNRSGDSPKTGSGKGRLRLIMPSKVKEIGDDEVVLVHEAKGGGGSGEEETVENDTVFAMIGREPPLDFFRRSGVTIHGEHTFQWWASLLVFIAFCFWLYHWKNGHEIPYYGPLPAWLSPHPAQWIASLQATLGQWASNPANPIGVLLKSAQGPSFYYTIVYCIVVVTFGIRRIRYRKTPYITWQTITLMCIQVIPLFILPELLLPWFHGLGWFDSGAGAWIASTFFPGQTWWRAYGLILAWPLSVYNWFTNEPIYGWLILGVLQTFVLIPGMIFFWGKGAYCGWICSCGALAETLGDRHRHKMPHGPWWNRLNMLGQAILLAAVVLMGLRIAAWAGVGWAQRGFRWGFEESPLAYAWTVDLMLAGVLGYGLYFWYSGRMWCRFACPLAALMHIYARFSRFRILADKKKCISCNVCTSVCHQGIDVMSFANKGEPMADVQCVRCSACVQSCPTGVLSFGMVASDGKTPTHHDPGWLAASPVRMREMHQVTVNGGNN